MGIFTDITRESAHREIFFFSLCLFAISLPLSRYFVTVSEILLVVNWLAEGDFRYRLRRLWADRPALAFIMVYLIGVIGLMWSRDPGYALGNDLFHKSPTLFLPLIFATTPAPDGKRTRIVLLMFIASVLIASVTGFIVREYSDDLFFRSASPFIPGIYLGLMLIIAAVQLPLVVRQTAGRGAWLYLSLIISGWFVFFLFYLRALSSIISLAAILIFLLTILVSRVRSTVLRAAIPAVTIILAGAALWPVVEIYRQVHAETEIGPGILPAVTVNGTPYLHDTVSIIRRTATGFTSFLPTANWRRPGTAGAILILTGWILSVRN